MHHYIVFLSASLLLAGCKQSESGYTTVTVYPTAQQCGVNEQRLACDQVAAYLRNTLKLQSGQPIIVSSVGSDPLPKEDPSLDRIAATLTAADFKDVRTARFDLR